MWIPLQEDQCAVSRVGAVNKLSTQYGLVAKSFLAQADGGGASKLYTPIILPWQLMPLKNSIKRRISASSDIARLLFSQPTAASLLTSASMLSYRSYTQNVDNIPGLGVSVGTDGASGVSQFSSVCQPLTTFALACWTISMLDNQHQHNIPISRVIISLSPF